MNNLKTIQVLLVEDNRADAVLLQDMLGAADPQRFELACCDRLGKALDRLRQRSFDAVLLDLTLPDSHGLATLDSIHAAAARVPIVVVTGAEDETLAIQAIRQGAQDYLVKGSLSAKGIARVIQYAIDRKRVEESLREAQRREMEAEAAAAARKALEESEKKYRELVESANSIIMRRRTDGTITFVNEFAQKFFGFREEELLGSNVVGTIVPAVETTGRDLAAMIRAIGADPEAYTSNENENICRDGRRVWVQWTNRALRNSAGEAGEILCVGVDITARKNAEAESHHYQQRLRSLANRLASTEEAERRRVSRYIHDTVIQSLALANIKLGSLKKAMVAAVPAEEIKKLDTARELIMEGIGECRQIMSDLTPAMLYELGLENALEDLVEKLAKQHDVDIRLEQEGESRPMEIALRGLLFQSTRELIVNALKHAGASRIHVSTCMKNDHIRICVKDDGVGMDSNGARVTRMKGTGGFGLFNLRERVEGLGGRFDITAGPGCGTTAVIVAPLAVKAAAPEAPPASPEGGEGP